LTCDFQFPNSSNEELRIVQLSIPASSYEEFENWRTAQCSGFVHSVYLSPISGGRAYKKLISIAGTSPIALRLFL